MTGQEPENESDAQHHDEGGSEHSQFLPAPS